jgi:hypothetical protein
MKDETMRGLLGEMAEALRPFIDWARAVHWVPGIGDCVKTTVTRATYERAIAILRSYDALTTTEREEGAPEVPAFSDAQSSTDPATMLLADRRGIYDATEPPPTAGGDLGAAKEDDHG